MSRARTTEDDRSLAYETDPAVRVVEDTIRAERAERRLYPDLYAERVVEALRAAGLLLEADHG